MNLDVTVLSTNDLLNPVVLLAKNFEDFAEQPALISGNQAISYANLKYRVRVLASWLDSLGVSSDVRVGIAVDEPVLFCELVLAVAWVGAVYVPVETVEFSEHARAKIDGAALAIVICNDAAIAAVCMEACEVATIPETWTDAKHEMGFVARPKQSAFNIMFTSGSSGAPKGVICPVGGVVPLVCGSCHIPIRSSDRVLQISARSFDAFTWELWGSLLNGACLVMAPPSWSILSLAQFIESEAITAAFFTSRLFDALIDAEPQSLRHMRLIAFGGENASIKHCQKAVELLPTVRLFNGYGPSENTTFTSSYQLDDSVHSQTRVPIGKPAGDDVTYLVDLETGELIHGPGLGELMVGGPGLAIGYTDPDLTLKRFVTHKALGQRLFLTGDLVERDSSGCYTWLGRRDREVKVRGRRVDLDEVEDALKEFEGISFASVQHNVLRQGEIIAFYTTATSQPASSEQIFRFLATKLSAHAMPRHLEFLRRVPLNAHGKADRSALATQLIKRLQSAHDSSEIAKLWRRYLPIDTFDASTDFFRAGGDSLSALNLLTDVERLTGARLEPEFISRYSTFGTFCEMLALEKSLSCLGNTGADGNPLFVFLQPLRESKPSPFLHLVAAMHETNHYVLDYSQIFQSSAPATLESFSRTCAEQIIKRKPQTVVVIGHSSGGAAALDLATGLGNHNVHVSLVIMLDSFAAGTRTALRLKNTLKKVFDPSVWQRLIKHLVKLEQRSHVSEGLSESSISIFELGRHVGGLLEPFRIRPRIPDGPRIVLFKAIHESVPSVLRSISDNGWGRSIPRIEVRPIDTTHSSMLHYDHAPAVAGLILKEIDLVGC